jgi:hypothetical protein
MQWTRTLSQRIVLKEGSIIATLGEARELMLSVPPDQRSAAWRFAIQWLTEAATENVALSDAEEVFIRALNAEGMISNDG